MTHTESRAEQLARYVDTAPKIAAELRRLDALNAQMMGALIRAEMALAYSLPINTSSALPYNAHVLARHVVLAAIAAATEGGAA